MAEKSKRLSYPELVFVVTTVGVMPGAESKAPKPLEELKPRDGWAGWAGFCAVLASKKLPPLRFGDGEV